ncbi:MAG: galactose-1-phosphate uridylyltransferase [Clostridiaceae bacterium]|jgi:UDPglucose--hexose-1-phosphate uridylyltransferase|nr:galactose-1-phosphate uridylyltransferase [Clostridiaceae bacterium]
MSRRKTTDIIAECVEQLLDHAVENISLPQEDVIYVRNLLLSRLKLEEPFDEPFKLDYDFQDSIARIVAYAVNKKIIDPGEELFFETEIFGMLTPPPSAITEQFDNVAADKSIEEACSWLFSLSKANNYIRMPDIKKNVKWTAENQRGNIQITINTAKPEKDAKQVLLESKTPTANYPRCALCPENVGFAGNLKRAARQTLRIIPVSLTDEPWYMQFSPYVYYDQHLIVFSQEHRPMELNLKSFERMAEFVYNTPHYFLGANAPLPIVGGSILSHDHYQGGSKVLPVFSAPARKHYQFSTLPDVKVSVVNWYNSVIRLESRNITQAVSAAGALLNVWSTYNAPEVDIISSSIDPVDGREKQHNTITPIARMNDRDICFDLILRNNRTDSKHPFGIFHPAEELHNIKKESIGLIEAMGLFILPGRLESETREIMKYLTGELRLDFAAIADEKNPLSKHLGMIMQLVNDYGSTLKPGEASDAVKNYINDTCEKILDTTAVFKNTPEGEAAFDDFMNLYTK